MRYLSILIPAAVMAALIYLFVRPMLSAIAPALASAFGG